MRRLRLVPPGRERRLIVGSAVHGFSGKVCETPAKDDHTLPHGWSRVSGWDGVPEGDVMGLDGERPIQAVTGLGRAWHGQRVVREAPAQDGG